MLNNKLKLAKTYDSCVSSHPKITVVMIHGIASDSSTYDHAIKYLEELKSLSDVRLVTFDLLGSGKSIKDDSLNYDYKDQLEALHNSIAELKLKTPLVLVGHSLGTFIVTRYTDTYKKSVAKLVLISPPVYTEKDLDNPAFEMGIKMFRDAVSIRNRKVLEEKSFNNSMDKIVLNRRNYKVLAELTTPTVMIYGNMDQLIAAYNIPRLVKQNSRHITAIETEGRHGITRDKYSVLGRILEEFSHA